jgi:hypothetical protein
MDLLEAAIMAACVVSLGLTAIIAIISAILALLGED